MERPQPFLLRCTHGRLALELRLLPAGRDWQVLLTGGDAHIGAVILAEPADAMPPDAPEAAQQPMLHTYFRKQPCLTLQRCQAGLFFNENVLLQIEF